MIPPTTGRWAGKVLTLFRSRPAGMALVALVGVMVLFGRFSDRIIHAELWGDEGWRFYPEAYASGFASLSWPDNGYLNTGQRLGALATVYLGVPLRWVPTAFALMALGVQLAVAMFLAGPRLARLWPDRSQRAAFALIYLALPSSWETLGNLTNIQWHLGLLAFMIVVAPPGAGFSWKVFDTVILLVSGLSGPFGVLLTPFCLYQVIAYRRQAEARVEMGWRALLTGGSAAVQVGFLLSGGMIRAGLPPLGASPIVLARMVATKVVLGLMLGLRTMGRLGSSSFLQSDLGSSLVATAAVAASIVVLVRGHFLVRAFCAFTCVVFAAELTSPVVSADMPQWVAMTVAGSWAGQRYFLYPMLGWACVLFALVAQRSPRLRAAGVIALVPVVFWAIPVDWLYPRVPHSDFVTRARAFEAAPAGSRFVFPTLPSREMVLIKKAE